MPSSRRPLRSIPRAQQVSHLRYHFKSFALDNRKDVNSQVAASSRPRTRLWARQQEQTEPQGRPSRQTSKGRTGNVGGIIQTSEPQRTGLQQTSHTDQPQQIGEVSKTTLIISRQRDLRNRKISYQQTIVRQPFETTNQHVDSEPPSVVAWLDGVNEPRQYHSPHEEPERSMESSSTPSGTSLENDDTCSITPSGTGTEKTARPQKGKATVNWDKLRIRRVAQTPTDDPQSDQLKSILLPKQIKIRFKDTSDLQDILREFLDVCELARPNGDCYDAVEDLINQIARWKPAHKLFTVSNLEFNKDIAVCRASNEAVLQRTLMTTLIDRWQLSNLFTFNCEGQWSMANYPLPSSGPAEAVSLPKPDLAIFFKLESLTTDLSVTFPKVLSECLRPDGGTWRCFPFLFIEAKRRGNDLEQAYLANAHSASQALYNMYVWMTVAGEQTTFFEKVRVFTVDLNAREPALWCYRAELDEQNRLRFEYQEVVSQKAYDRDDACLLIRNVLTEYGERKLHTILKKTFQRVTSDHANGKLQHLDERKPKRKADMGSSFSDKRSRGTEATSSQINVTESFGISGVSVTPNDDQS